MGREFLFLPRLVMRWPTKKRDDDRRPKKDCSWFVAIEKRVVLTEVRGFGDPHFDKTRCLPIIRKLLYLLNQGETFTKSEAAALLTSAVNLYRFEDVHLRRMFYLIAKELCPVADEVALVTTSLLKDINTDHLTYRANAIRLLPHITNGTSLTQVVKCLVKCLKGAYWNHGSMVESAVFVCAINLVKRNPRMVITHGTTLINTMIASIYVMVQTNHVRFHAFYLECLLRPEYCIRWYTRDLFSSWFSIPLEPCILARGISQIARAKPVSVEYHPNYYKYVKFCIYHKNEMVAIEGFRALEELRDISITELKPAIDVIRRILRVSHKPVLRFAAFRALQKVTVAHRVGWITPEDHIAIGLDMNVNNLYMDEVNHRDKEAQVERVSQVIKSQSIAIKEVSTHNLRRRLV